MNTGFKIYTNRREQGLSQAILARFCSVDQTVISRIENGRRRVPKHALAPLSAVLGIDEGELYTYNLSLPKYAPVGGGE